MFKRFLEWIGVKEKLHHSNYKPPLFKENEVWWCYLGENIGAEINGKGDKFTRPIFILRKYDKFSFLALPLTTKNKKGTWYVSINFLGKIQTVVLSQGRVLDYRRFKEKIGQLEYSEVERIKLGYLKLHNSPKIDLPPIGGSRG